MATRVVEQGRIDKKNEVATQVEEDETACSLLKPTSPLQFSAYRDRKILNTRVKESAFEYKTQTQKLNWVMLLNTMKQISSIEKTEKDLYERYGIFQTTLPDGTVVCENRMLSDRAHSKLYAHTYRRPVSYQPPPLHLRSIAKTGYFNLSRRCFSCVRITNTCYQNKRPRTI
ncbi:hypothetical protein DPMN_144299 [Dreissena polymorpha]|uniref:Uncharacterized protein n=1 Tax=Dreissena polymorpha TaxID=45954 RepID=A0A9D4GFC6_DREPO|nr:hypothetical protein DPMN_144299 [Dreissena polymorpha]